MNHQLLIRPAQLNQAFESNSSSGSSGVTRRSFIKRTGGATVATLVAWNLQITNARASGESGSGSGSTRKLIKCVAWPDPAENKTHNFPGGSEKYFTSIDIAGASEGQKATEFTLTVTAIGTHTWQPWHSNSTTTEGVQEVLQIKLYLDGDTIKSALMSGDGSDKNGDMEILVSGAPMTQFKAYLMKTGWSLSNGKVGWNADGASAELSFASGSTTIDSVGIGAAFTVVTE